MENDFFGKNKFDDWDNDDDLKYLDEDEIEERKLSPTRPASIALGKKWSSILFVLEGLLDKNKNTEDDILNAEDDYATRLASFNLTDAYEVIIKIKSAMATHMYIVYMENASIIRKNVQSIKSSLLLFDEMNVEESYAMLLRTEIEDFQLLFKQWVATFQKDEFEDEWGLFI
jgi:hypothetical protein